LCTDGRPTQSDDKGSPFGSGELKKKGVHSISYPW
jgi:hypothetical protein